MPFVTAGRLVAGFVIACIVLVGAPARAEPSASAPEDIQYLLDAIGRSGCEFYRNGSWYAAADARSHLASKYREVDKKRPVALGSGLHRLGRHPQQHEWRAVPRPLPGL